jgi:hypothetical protein
MAKNYDDAMEKDQDSALSDDGLNLTAYSYSDAHEFRIVEE